MSTKCDKNGACKKAFEDKANKHGGHKHPKPAKPANDQCPAPPAKPKSEDCCPSKKDKCCP